MQSLLARGALENFETIFSSHSLLCAQCLVLIKLPRIGLMKQSFISIWQKNVRSNLCNCYCPLFCLERHHMAHIGMHIFLLFFLHSVLDVYVLSTDGQIQDFRFPQSSNRGATIQLSANMVKLNSKNGNYKQGYNHFKCFNARTSDA